MTDDSVSFTWKDYRDGARRKVETVSGDEFVRRFLIHILPKGFQRIRHYGFLARRNRTEKIARIRLQLGVPMPSADEGQSENELDIHLEEEDSQRDELRPPRCPHCGSDNSVWKAEIQPTVGWVAQKYGNFARRVQGAGFDNAPRPP